MSRFSRALVATALLSAACSDPVDKAAKQRIFSPEAPPQVISAAHEKLPPEAVAEDSRVARRVLGMDAAEVVERLGAHVYTAEVDFEWSGPGNPVRLSEQRTLIADRGGVGGDFLARVENSRDQGLEVMRVAGKVYARHRYGRYRQRLRDRGMAERTRSELQGALRDVDTLFGGRMTLASQGTERVAGRPAWRYTVALAPRALTTASATPKLPPPIEPKGGRDATTLRRLRFLKERQPVALEGEVWVDEASSVILKSRLDGRIHMPAHGEEGPAELRLQVRTALTDIGKAPGLTAPPDFLPDADKPQGIADALDRFGILRGEEAADAGTATLEPPDDA